MPKPNQLKNNGTTEFIAEEINGPYRSKKDKSQSEESDWSLNPLTTVGWYVGFYGISTFVGYLTPNPFLYK